MSLNRLKLTSLARQTDNLAILHYMCICIYCSKSYSFLATHNFISFGDCS